MSGDLRSIRCATAVTVLRSCRGPVSRGAATALAGDSVTRHSAEVSDPRPHRHGLPALRSPSRPAGAGRG